MMGHGDGLLCDMAMVYSVTRLLLYFYNGMMWHSDGLLCYMIYVYNGMMGHGDGLFCNLITSIMVWWDMAMVYSVTWLLL